MNSLFLLALTLSEPVLWFAVGFIVGVSVAFVLVAILTAAKDDKD